MRPIKLALLSALIYAEPAFAACLAPIDLLQKNVSDASSKLDSVGTETEAGRAKVISTYRDVDVAVAGVTAARAAKNEKSLDTAIATLATAKKTYDAAVTAERPLLIARLETERTLRGARQALNEAAADYREQGEALVRAAKRAQHGEIVPSLADLLVCEQDACGPIPAKDHAAMIAIGAIAGTLDAKPWPTVERQCDFTLLNPTTAHQAISRQLLTEQRTLQADAQKAEAALLAARKAMVTGIAPWDASITSLVGAHSSPASNSHADEILGMAVEELQKQDAAFDLLTVPYRAADEAAVAARKKVLDASARVQAQFEYWTRVGQATVSAAILVQQDALSQVDPPNRFEKAALGVMGAMKPDPISSCVLEPAADPVKTWVFAPMPKSIC